MSTAFNSQNILNKEPFGAVKCSSRVKFTVNYPDAENMYLIGFDKDIKMEKDNDTFSASFIVPNLSVIISYFFKIQNQGQEMFLIPKHGVGGECISSNDVTSKYQLTVHSNRPTPDWFKGAVMYQIYTDRFAKGDNNAPIKENVLIHSSWDDKPLYIFDDNNRIVTWDFFGGNLQGVIDKIDYIKNLGVDVIYLNPIFEASSNHKYDTGDYTKVDSMYGDEDVLAKLVKEADDRGLIIMLDGVFSHTGDDSVYFNKYGLYDTIGACQDENSPYYSWYQFTDYPDKYESWWGIDALPEIDKNNMSYREFLFNSTDGIIKKWMTLGIMGWRLDVADELPDDFIKQMKMTAREHCDAPVLLGEVWEDASNKVSYGEKRNYIIDDTLDSVSNYPLRDSIIDYLLHKTKSTELCRLIMSLQENYPADVFQSLMNMTGTHDSVRLATLLGNAPNDTDINQWEKRRFSLDPESYELSIKRLKLFYLILFTLPGNPCVYYGDETAMQGHKDPYNRGTFPWGDENENLQNFLISISKLRKDIGIKGCGFFEYTKNSDSLLKYNILTDSKVVTVIVNSSETQHKDVDLSDMRVIFNYRANAGNDIIYMQPLSGAVVISSRD